MVLEVAHGSSREINGPKKAGPPRFWMSHGPNGNVTRNVPFFSIEPMAFLSKDLFASKGLRWLMRAKATTFKTKILWIDFLTLWDLDLI